MVVVLLAPQGLLYDMVYSIVLPLPLDDETSALQLLGQSHCIALAFSCASALAEACAAAVSAVLSPSHSHQNN